MEKPILKIKNVIKRYASGFKLDIPHLEFQAGKIYGLTGPNGAGKTTLLNLLNFLEEPDKGEILFNEQEVKRNNSLLIRRKMTMVMENPLLFKTTVFYNMTVGLRCRSIEKKMWPHLVEEALNMLELQGFEKRYAPSLSRGEIQRVAIVRAIILHPDVLLLDEPFTNIDKKNVTALEKLMKDVNHTDQTTVIFTTHDHSQAYRLSDEVISLIDGKTVNGSLENLFKGVIEDCDGAQSVKISPGIFVAVETEKRGEVHMSVAPQEIILSKKDSVSCVRNSFKGFIQKIHLEGNSVRISVMVDDGVEFIVLITKSSCQELKLTVDTDVFLYFKRASVQIF